MSEVNILEQIIAPIHGGDIYRFSCSGYDMFPALPGNVAPGLRQSDLFDPEDECDHSPNAEWFVRFTERFAGRCWLIGYRMDDDRFDRRVSIEGILIEQPDLAKNGNTPALQRVRVLAEAADTLLKSKEPDECSLYIPGMSNTLDVPIIRYWWD